MTLLPAAGYRRAEPATAVTGSSTPALSWPAPNASRPAALSGPALEVVDTDTLAALRHDAQEGRKVAAAAKAQKIEAAVDEALRLGKIAPSRRRHWVTLCTHDEGMLEVLAAVPPLSSKGLGAVVMTLWGGR